ncbi:MAG: methionyl-tRNA formyltransferase [Holosporaceae bacterium]|jgi:methionyl-tRNA formyltransferase|nr:methionyl-tRNA formyltransferase [Holosporaceae bacterium]
MEKLRVIFMGTADFSVKSLAALCNNAIGLDIVGVYTKPPKPSGRNYKIQKSDVHRFAEAEGIPVFHPKNFRSTDDVEKFRSLKPDVAVVSSYGLIIPQNLLEIPRYGFINIHASLLPRWRGASPIRSAILADDKRAGITIMKMDPGVDTGDIISMKSVDISAEMNHGELSNQLGDIGAAMIVETLNDLEGNLAKSYKQPEEGITYADKITKDSCKINWNDSAENISRCIRALAPTPAAWAEIGDLRIKIFSAEIVDMNEHSQCGLICEGLIVACRTGSLKLTEVQPSGKNRMSGDDFMRGHRNLIGATFNVG